MLDLIPPPAITGPSTDGLPFLWPNETQFLEQPDGSVSLRWATYATPCRDRAAAEAFYAWLLSIGHEVAPILHALRRSLLATLPEEQRDLPPDREFEVLFGGLMREDRAIPDAQEGGRHA